MHRNLTLTSFLCALTLVSAVTPAQAQTTLLLRSVRSIDVAKNTVVLPLHRGTSGGKTVWYILTDVSTPQAAQAEKLIFAPALAGVGSTQRISVHAGVWNFAAAPDFTPGRVFTPGPGGFPPAKAAPGATAGTQYSPFVSAKGAIYNAPIIASGDGPFDVTTHTNTADRVLAIDKTAGTVTLLLADGFASGKRVLYISTEASDPGAAAIERATLAPAIARSPQSARLPIYVIVNGQSQGLAYAALHGNLSQNATAANSGSLKTSRNILGGLPASLGTGGSYDPLWNVSVGAWTAAAVKGRKNTTLTSADSVQAQADAKLLTAPGGKPFGPAGFAVNCPVIAIDTP